MDDISSEWDQFSWNEGLARAARHLVNDMGPCSTYGDANSDFLPEILSKYYAHSYDELEYMELRVNPFGYIKYEDSEKSEHPSIDTSGHRVLEYILSQECIDKSILRTTSQLEMGVACSCSGDRDDSPLERGFEMLCYIVVARKVEVKHIIEKIPGYMTLEIEENKPQSCSSKCYQTNS